MSAEPSYQFAGMIVIADYSSSSHPRDILALPLLLTLPCRTRIVVMLALLLLFCFPCLHILMSVEQSEPLRDIKLKAEDDDSDSGNGTNRIRFNKIPVKTKDLFTSIIRYSRAGGSNQLVTTVDFNFALLFLRREIIYPYIVNV